MRAALFQACTGIDPAASAAALSAAAAKAHAQGADMLFTPEMTNILDRDRARAAASITTEDQDRVLAAAREAAAKHGLWLHIGSLALKGGADDRYLNRAFVIDDSGAIRARYDKIHLFDVDLPGGVSWRESDSYSAGSQPVAVDTPWGRIGLSICYDLRFPDLYRALSDEGAVILAIPAAFTAITGAAHWHILQRARAIEAGAFVIAAAQSGTHADGRETYGHSLVVDPWGSVMLDMGDDAEVTTIDIDLAKVDQIRTRVPAIRNRRPIGAVEVAA
ncbi:putative amidohydrolase [Sphingomonas vulcanisoli]|uniref:Amidohydrolase n=1 Tax=Sphingomonas vulcanisoli TaxID=1658060 RepID=A0ABX0TQF6_9SPHN|nr:carbon-nitrogen hydrolase family protein [Sphingomonas vulcanisoli]NIJ07764.1 putative amidohydrolase [Sphingomonas vulcanisoli]